MQDENADLLLEFSKPLVGLSVSHVWNGIGSALFLEFGNLTPTKLRDGGAGNPRGEMSVMIEWSWRIEGRRSIICGSWCDASEWKRGFSLLQDTTVADVSLFGRLPEIDLAFSNAAHCLSFMTEKGQPQWVIFDRRSEASRCLYSRNGFVELDDD